MAGSNTIEFTDGNFESEVLNSSVPVLVDFWNEWCAPCRALEPTIDEIALEFSGRAKVGKLNLERNQSTGIQFDVSMLPTVLVFKGGEVIRKFIGMTGKRELATALHDALH